MGFRLKKAEVLTLRTRDEVLQEAAKLKGYGGTECEREERHHRKEKIRARIFGHEMRPFVWATGEVLEPAHKGLVRRVDGQHSSEVFLELTPEEWSQVSFPVVIFREYHDCDTLLDLAVLFEQFNPPWSSRSSEDLIGAHVAVHDDLQGLKDRAVLDRVTKGLSWYARAVGGKPKGQAGQFQIVHDNHDTHAFLLWCGSFLQKGKTKEMFPAPVVGAMRHTFDAADPAAGDFWKRVATGGKTQNEEGSAEYKLADFLANLDDPKAEWPRSVAKHLGRGGKPSEGQVFATCLNAYRAWRSGKRVGDIFDPVKGKRVKEVAAEYGQPLPAAA